MTIIANGNLALRLVSVWFNEQGNLESVDQAITGWYVGNEPHYAVAIPAGPHVAQQVVAQFIRDNDQKNWIDAEGHVFSQWKDVVGPLYAARDLSHPPAPAVGVDWPLDAPSPTPRQAPVGKPPHRQQQRQYPKE